MAFSAAAQQELIDWFEMHGRDLPWRRTRDPYRIMVSEIMLQQTQVDRVAPKYQAFLELFPTLAALADAPTSAVIRAWAGLGYNRRAINLQRACRMVVETNDGVMPDSVDELLNLPGIGPYTAGAIACFAFGRDVGFVDTNIRRVLHRVTAGVEFPVPALSERELMSLASDLVPEGDGYVWNQALIELGALVCRSRQVECEACPVASFCSARPEIGLALANQTAAPKRAKQPRFETTSRYIRGRIVDFLRDVPAGLSASDLALRIYPENSDEIWVLEYIDGLLNDGLIVIDSGLAAPRQRRTGEATPRPYDVDPLAVRYRLPD